MEKNAAVAKANPGGPLSLSDATTAYGGLASGQRAGKVDGVAERMDIPREFLVPLREELPKGAYLRFSVYERGRTVMPLFSEAQWLRQRDGSLLEPVIPRPGATLPAEPWRGLTHPGRQNNRASGAGIGTAPPLQLWEWDVSGSTLSERLLTITRVDS